MVITIEKENTSSSWSRFLSRNRR